MAFPERNKSCLSVGHHDSSTTLSTHIHCHFLVQSGQTITRLASAVQGQYQSPPLLSECIAALSWARSEEKKWKTESLKRTSANSNSDRSARQHRRPERQSDRCCGFAAATSRRCLLWIHKLHLKGPRQRSFDTTPKECKAASRGRVFSCLNPEKLVCSLYCLSLHYLQKENQLEWGFHAPLNVNILKQHAL